MTVRGGRWALLGVALLFIGCGGAEVVDEGEGEAVRGVLRQSTAIETPAVDPEVAKLARFWTVDRFLLDGSIGPTVRYRHTTRLLAKAQPDECFTGVGLPNAPAPVNGECLSGGQPKTNDAYVWGLTRVGQRFFFGTLANTNCLVEAGYLGVMEPHLNPLYVCEFGARGPAGDFRSPNLFRYDLATKTIVSLNPAPGADGYMQRLTTSGFRSAGTLLGKAFIAGPARGSGISLFVFDGATDEQLAAKVINDPRAGTDPTKAFTNVRQWVAAKGDLYVGVGRRDGTGAVLRWTKTDAYEFEIVGEVPADAANMIFHTDGRIYITTWPNSTQAAALYRSPVIPSCGLTAAHANAPEWSTALWTATQYDPDVETAMHYGGGALASWKGRIIFGTMHVPFSATRGAMERYGLDDSKLLQTALGTHRSIAIFEVKFPAGKPRVSMLYGEKYLPTYDATTGSYTIRYDKAHRTGFVPRWGPSGFGNFFNAYTWTMDVLNRDLYVGTFDWSQLVAAELEGNPQASKYVDLLGQLSRLGLMFPREGADLMRFRDDGVWAESVNGLGNDRNYGLRNMIDDGESLYIGTANPMNLDPKGGWELLRVKPM